MYTLYSNTPGTCDLNDPPDRHPVQWLLWAFNSPTTHNQSYSWNKLPNDGHSALWYSQWENSLNSHKNSQNAVTSLSVTFNSPADSKKKSWVCHVSSIDFHFCHWFPSCVPPLPEYLSLHTTQCFICACNCSALPFEFLYSVLLCPPLGVCFEFWILPVVQLELFSILRSE